METKEADNTTIVTMTDMQGNAINWVSGYWIFRALPKADCD